MDFLNTKKIIKSRELAREGYKLSINEHRLILSALSKVRRGEPCPKFITVTAAEFVRDWSQVKTDAAYKLLQAASDRLFDRKVKLKGKKKELWFRWVTSIAYVKNEAHVMIQFHEDLRPHIAELDKNFIQFRMNEIKDLRSSHAIRLFELLMQYRNENDEGKCNGGELFINLDDFRHALDLTDKKTYKNFGELKRRVIEPAVHELNEKSAWVVTHLPIKKGRKVVALKFGFAMKNQRVLDLV